MSKCKDRWNNDHYDQILFRAGAGSKQLINMLAEINGLSTAAYIRSLIIRDAQEKGITQISEALGGSVQAQSEIMGKLNDFTKKNQLHQI
ncbi:MAG: hypothetical protein NC093_02545 [Alistipes sp.]|nr:hypothetical protein [Alistipes sp.]